MEADAGVRCPSSTWTAAPRATASSCSSRRHVLGASIRRPKNTETTSLGAAYLAGLASGFWSGIDELKALRETDDVFRRQMDPQRVDKLVAGWHDAVRRVM
jgi:glycerol kinase